MCDHIKCLLPIEVSDESTQDVIEMDSDLAELTSFYGDRLDGYFERY